MGSYPPHLGQTRAGHTPSHGLAHPRDALCYVAVKYGKCTNFAEHLIGFQNLNIKLNPMFDIHVYLYILQHFCVS